MANAGRNPALRAMLTGVDIGDGWGYPNERHTYENLVHSLGRGPELPAPDFLLASDDTQLSLALAKALDGTAGATREAIQQWIIDNYLAWLHDPDMRGYGRTTLNALSAIDEGRPWFVATGVESEVCGTVMRTSACTHGGPSAIAAAVVATGMFRKLLAGEAIPQLLSCAIAVCDDAALASAAAGWIVEHPRAGDAHAATQLMAEGMKAVRSALVRARRALPMFTGDPWCADVSDPRYGGEGWLARDALACALLSVDMLPGRPLEAIRRAVLTGGDSDTIGAITGMFIGAKYGHVWPTEWSDRIEPRYHEWILDAEGYLFG